LSFPSLPTTARELNGWLSALLIGYLIVSYSIHGVRCWWNNNFKAKADHAKKLFDGVTFAGSSIMMIGVIFESRVLDLIGDTTFYLVIGGVAGIGYAVRSLFPPFV
jgi:hypothetical protein